ncbi:MAG: hypothetical protein OET90_06405 [Desulfuromonadales bacterium]|nr:hypothetical protein [Desulfuromonadales bacterium]
MATQKAKQLDIELERQSLREAIASLSRPQGGESDWCVACGASSSSFKLDAPSDAIRTMGETLTLEGLKDFAGTVKDFGENAWCVACGAGKDASPISEIVNPADIPDAVIDELSEKILGKIKVGR